MTTNNPKLYRELSEPLSSVDAANEAVIAFGKELAELRAKHRIRDVLVVMSGACIYPDGQEGEFIVSRMCGDALKQLLLSAWLLGFATDECDAMVEKAISGKSSKSS